MKYVNPRFAKSGEYKKVLENIAFRGKCPFCPENFKYHKNPILKKEGGWFITKSGWPYKNSKYHFLIIGKNHKDAFDQLSINDFKTVKILATWAIKKFDLKGGGLMLRFGDTNHTGATVTHLHFHLITPTLKNGKSVPVNFPIG